MGTTALIIELSAAQILLDAARQVRAELVRPDISPHATILYPFLPLEELTDEVDQAIIELAARMPKTDVELAETIVAPGFLAMAVPQLQSIAHAFYQRWPEVKPYGGRFGSHPPVHLTVAMGATEQEIALVEKKIQPHLPVCDQANKVHLVALTPEGWRLRLSAALGE